MNVTLIYASDDVHVHRTGCADVAKASRGAVTVYAIEAGNRQAVADDF